MRLRILERGHSLPRKLMFAMMRAVSKQDVPDVLRMLMYRAGWFGAAYSRWVQAVMREPAPWSVGERELMAAYVSSVNQCPF